MEHTAGLISLETALKKMLSRLSAVNETQTLNLLQAVGRITATAVISPLDVPGFDNSAMDGYAVRMADLQSGHALPVAGKAFAGQPYSGIWPEGTCIRIMTGAPIPTGTDTVIMQEDADICEHGVRFPLPVQSGGNIRRRGEDILAGTSILSAGVKLSAAELALIASLGIKDVTVYRPVKAAVFSTGDELRLPGQHLAEGQIYDTNRLAVHIMLAQLGCEVIDLGIIPDNEEALRTAFHHANQLADVVISSGGVSVGEADYTRHILEELGDVDFWKLAIKPGKPFAFGRLSNSWFCGLPGNPVSAAVTFYQLVQPLLARLSGQQGALQPVRLRARSLDKLKKSPGRLDFQRGILSRGASGELEVKSTGHQGSHIFSSFSQANCFVVLASERGHVEAGEWVDVEPFNALFGG